MTKYNNHDAYIAAAPEQFHAMLGQLRAQLSRALPDAEEVIKYDLPGFQIKGRSSRAMLPSLSNVVYMLIRVQLLPMLTRSLL